MQQSQRPNSTQCNRTKPEDPDLDVSAIQKLLPSVSDNEVNQVIMLELSKRRSKLRQVLETRRLVKFLSKALQQSKVRLERELQELNSMQFDLKMPNDNLDV